MPFPGMIEFAAKANQRDLDLVCFRRADAGIHLLFKEVCREAMTLIPTSELGRGFIEWRSRPLTRKQAGWGQSAIGNQKNVCAKPLRRRSLLWALNERPGDSQDLAGGHCTMEPGDPTEPVARRQREYAGQRAGNAQFCGIVMVRGR